MITADLFPNSASFISIKEAASILNISEATVKNWLKLDILESNKIGKKNFLLKKSVNELKEKILKGDTDKLQKRANKKFISKKRRHDELNNPFVELFLEKIDDIFIQFQSQIEELLITVGYKILDSEIAKNGDSKWTYSLLAELEGWANESIHDLDRIDSIKDLIPDVPDVLDILGKVYQHLSLSSEKAIGGVFYTPNILARKLLNEIYSSNDNVLDPSCGSGSFLIAALITKLENNEPNPLQNIYGIDLDKIAIKICRFNLILIAKDKYEGSLNIICNDSLSFLNKNDIFPEEFDLIITNPPWGANFEVPYNCEANLAACFTDSFAAFLAFSFKKLSSGGRLSFILPESFLDVASHSPIRKFLLMYSSEVKINHLGKVFNGLMTNVIDINLKKSLPLNNSVVSLFKEGSQTTIVQNKLLEDKHSSFIFNVGSAENTLLEKIFKYPHTYIKKDSKFVLGIVTGNNAKLIKLENNGDLEVIIKGKDVCPFKIKEAGSFIRFDKKQFQQCADESYFRVQEKLIYRFISNKLIIAYDNQQRLTLNSANVLIPSEELPIKVLLGVLQSKVIEFVFKTKYNTLKVLKNHIQSLPIFTFDQKTLDAIEQVINEILVSCDDKMPELEKRLNEIIYNTLDLNGDEIKTIENFLLKQ
jgi:type I restriction-modification system DNA methylase subunit